MRHSVRLSPRLAAMRPSYLKDAGEDAVETNRRSSGRDQGDEGVGIMSKALQSFWAAGVGIGPAEICALAMSRCAIRRA